MRLFYWTMLACLTLSHGSQSFAGQETHGDDVLAWVKPSEVKLFDHVECVESFNPQTFERDVWGQLSGWLGDLDRELLFPETATYLRSFFKGGKLQWCFVELPLANIADEGQLGVELGLGNEPSWVLAKWKRQIARTTKSGLVQIDRTLFDKLTSTEKSKLFLHEVLWHAFGFDSVIDATPIRLFVNLIAEGVSTSRTHDDFFALASSYSNKVCGKSRLLDKLRLDHRVDETLVTHLKVIPGNFSSFDRSVVGRFDESGRQLASVSFLNPLRGDPSVYVDKYRNFYEVQFHGSSVSHLAVSSQNLCRDLNIDDGLGWRLPTHQEIADLFSLGLGEMTATREVFKSVTFVNDTPELPTQSLFESDFLYPLSQPLILISAENKLVDVKREFQDVTAENPAFTKAERDLTGTRTVNGRVIMDSANRRQIKFYPSFFCIKTLNP